MVDNTTYCDIILYMKILEVAMVVSSVLWLASCVFLIYSIGKAILMLSLAPLVTGVIIFAGALLALFIVAFLVDY